MSIAQDAGGRGTTAWMIVLAIGTVAGSLVTACMMPFVALATVTAATMTPRRSMMTLIAAWATNQIIGFFLLGFPLTMFAVGWGVALGAASLVAMLAASSVLGSLLPGAGRLVAAFLLAFAAYETGLFGFALFAGGAETFTGPIVLKIFVNDACWFAGLLASNAVLTRAAPQIFGHALRISPA